MTNTMLKKKDLKLKIAVYAVSIALFFLIMWPFIELLKEMIVSDFPMDKLVADSFTIATDSVIELSMSALIPNATYDVIVQSDGAFSEDQQDPTFWTNLIDGGLPYYLDLSVINGNTVRLHIDANAVPEPSTWGLLVLGVAGLMYWRKRK